jgi:hypothetical protein
MLNGKPNNMLFKLSSVCHKILMKQARVGFVGESWISDNTHATTHHLDVSSTLLKQQYQSKVPIFHYVLCNRKKQTLWQIRVVVFWVVTPCSENLVASIFRMKWRWRQHGPPKRRYPTTTLLGVTTQKTSTWIFIAVKTPNLASWQVDELPLHAPQWRSSVVTNKTFQTKGIPIGTSGIGT